MKIKPAGKAAIAFFVLLIVFMVWRSDQPKPVPLDLSVPASTSPWALPISSLAIEKKFDAHADTILDPCAFFDDYQGLRSVPIDFNAYVDPGYEQSPYYMYDGSNGLEFLPAYVVTGKAGSVDDAVAEAGGDASNAPSCLDDSSGGVVPVLLAVPRTQHPTSLLVTVYGVTIWDSADAAASLGQTTTEALTPAPVVQVANIQPLSLSQVTSPALASRVINTAVQVGPIVIRLGRLEFAQDETRVWVDISNKSNQTVDPWLGLQNMTLTPYGKEALQPEETDESSVTGNDPDLSDLFPTDQLAPYADQQGYVVFQPVDFTQPLTLSFPDDVNASEATNPFVLHIQPTAPGSGL